MKTKSRRVQSDSSESTLPPLQTGSVVNEIEHDGLGRRIVKQVKNSADLDCTYHYYHDGDRVIEERNGSDQDIKQYVWGTLYIDELVQVGLNDDPADGSEQDVESFYYALHDTHLLAGCVYVRMSSCERFASYVACSLSR